MLHVRVNEMLSQLGIQWMLMAYADATRELCGKNDVHSQGLYLWNNNIWNADDTGSACTYVPDQLDSESNKFEVLWQWSGAPFVRGFPHVEFKPKLLPIRLNKLESLIINSAWGMTPVDLEASASHDPTAEPNTSALEKENVEANVCVDIFADPDGTTSTMSAKQMYEIMIWFGQFGSGALPVGNTELLDPPVVTLIQGTEFKLYTGKNFNGQVVHSWVANKTLTEFSMDFTPLLNFLSVRNMVPADVYLGTVQFGTETFGSSSQVKFTVASFEASMKAFNDMAEGSATLKDNEGGSGSPDESSISGARRTSAFSAGTAAWIAWVMIEAMLVA